jgi:cold shock CspA family protein
MEVLGQVTRWDDDKGFGFITPEQGGVPVFAHISAMRGERRPCVGDRVLFVPDAGEGGRPRAQHIRLAGELSLDEPSIRKRPARTSRAPGRSARVRAQSQPIAMAYWLLAFACLAVPIAGVWYVTAQSGWPCLFAPSQLLLVTSGQFQWWPPTADTCVSLSRAATRRAPRQSRPRTRFPVWQQRRSYV